MSPFDSIGPKVLADLAHMRRQLEQMNSGFFFEKLDEWERGGLPADSMPEHVTGGDPAIPVNERYGRGEPNVTKDELDRVIRTSRAAYVDHVTTACAHISDAVKLARSLVPPQRLDDEGHVRAEYDRWRRKLVDDLKHAHCSNPSCARVVECTPSDRLKSGRCNACYQYRRDHDGRERPRDLVEAELGRRRAS